MRTSIFLRDAHKYTLAPAATRARVASAIMMRVVVIQGARLIESQFDEDHLL